MNYDKGQRFRLTQEHGNAPGSTNPAFRPDGLTNPDGTVTIHPLPDGYPLREGLIGTVVDVVPPEVDGAGNHEEEHVVFEFQVDYPSPHVRNVSFTQAQMTALFEEAE